MNAEKTRFIQRNQINQIGGARMNAEKTRFIQRNQINQSQTLELKNGRLIDVVNGRYFDDGLRLILKGGKIAAMPTTEENPDGIQPDHSIDLAGKTVFPGLFNVHCHIQMVNPTLIASLKTIKETKKFHDQQVEKNMADCLACGVTNIRDAFTDDLEANRLLAHRITNGEIPGPRIQQAVVVGPLGGYLSPQPRGLKKALLGMMGVGSFDYERRTSGVVAFPASASVQQVRDAVDRAIDERGADLIKVGESLEESLLNANPTVMTMDQLSAITDQARRRGLQSTIHSVSATTFNRAVRAGFSSLAHMARDAMLLPQDVRACLASGSLIEPTLSVGYDMSWKLPGNSYAGDPNMDLLYRFREKTYRESASRFWLPQLKSHVLEGFDKASRGQFKMLGLIDLSKLLRHFCPLIHFGVANTRALLQEGVPMACGNDGGIQSCTPAMVRHEISLFDLFMNGQDSDPFDPVKALQTARINSARSMGLEGSFGSLQVGKTADLVIAEGDPLVDAAVIGQPAAALFMDGRLVIDNCGLAP